MLPECERLCAPPQSANVKSLNAWPDTMLDHDGRAQGRTRGLVVSNARRAIRFYPSIVGIRKFSVIPSVLSGMSGVSGVSGVFDCSPGGVSLFCLALERSAIFRPLLPVRST